MIITVAGNLCNKCPKQLLEQNSSYSDYFNATSGLYRTAEPKEALLHKTIEIFIEKMVNIFNWMKHHSNFIA